MFLFHDSNFTREIRICLSHYLHHRKQSLLMLAMLLVATALMKFNVAYTKPRNTTTLPPNIVKRGFYDEDIADLEQIQGSEQEKEIEKRRKLFIEQRRLSMKNNYHKNMTDDAKKFEPEEEIDVVDREDHITQFLGDLFVNTDSEITGLQATEEEEVPDANEKNDGYFEFLTRGEGKTDNDDASVEFIS